MSYDLLFWRGGLRDAAPRELLEKFSRLEFVDGVVLLNRKEVIEAFRRAFQGEIEIESSAVEAEVICGWLYEVRLNEPLQCLWVTCSWEVLKQPQVLQKLTIAGYCHLGCHMYNPQIDEFVPAQLSNDRDA